MKKAINRQTYNSYYFEELSLRNIYKLKNFTLC